MTKSKKPLKFGSIKLDPGVRARFISFTMSLTGSFKIKPRKLRNPDAFFTAVEIIIGMKREPGESIPGFIIRVTDYWSALPSVQRKAACDAVDKKDFYEALGIVTHKTTILPAPSPKRRRISIDRPTPEQKAEFFASWDWRTLRFQALKAYGRECCCCGARPGTLTAQGNPVVLHVDHIKPVSLYWSLRLSISNLQVLCSECNQGKGNWDETDFRPV